MEMNKELLNFTLDGMNLYKDRLLDRYRRLEEEHIWEEIQELNKKMEAVREEIKNKVY